MSFSVSSWVFVGGCGFVSWCWVGVCSWVVACGCVVAGAWVVRPSGSPLVEVVHAAAKEERTRAQISKKLFLDTTSSLEQISNCRDIERI